MTILRAFKSGNSLVLTVPVFAVKKYSVKKGDVFDFRAQDKGNKTIFTFVRMKVRTGSSFFETKMR